MTNPVLIVDDLDYAAVLVLHWGRGHWLFWLHWLCCFLLQLLLGDNTNKNILTKSTQEKTHEIHPGALFLKYMHRLNMLYGFYLYLFSYEKSGRKPDASTPCWSDLSFWYLRSTQALTGIILYRLDQVQLFFKNRTEGFCHWGQCWCWQTSWTGECLIGQCLQVKGYVN